MFTKHEKCVSITTRRTDHHMAVSSHCFIRYKMAPIWILMLILHTNDSQDVNRVDNFALISGTLRTFQRAKCDEELVTLNCPKGTTISIQFAQYGKSGASKTLCPPIQSPTYHHEDVMASRRGLYHYNTQPTNVVNSSNNISCIWPSALQYSLLQTVVEACHKKRQCKFHPSTHTFGGDPCPGVRKFVEVAYKCRPYEFLSETACENDKIQLECDVNHRVAVFSASYGRTEYESVHCPQPKGVPEESCMVSFATEAVMNLCHGKRRCTLTADTATFGNPCRPASRMYLKVVYTCVPRTVLKEMYDSPLEDDEQDTIISVEEPIEDYDRSTPVDQEFYQESFAVPPVTKIEVNRYNNNNYTRISPQVTSTGTPSHRRTKDFDTTNSESSLPKVFKNQSQMFPSYPSKNQYTPSTTDQTMQGDSESKAINDADQPFNKLTSGVLGIVVFVTQNQERFYLIVIISVSICIVIVLGLLGAHFIMSRRQNHDDGKYQRSGGEHNMPREFVDDISDINDDMALGTPLPINSANTLPRSNSGMQNNVIMPPPPASPIVDHTNVNGPGGLQRNMGVGGGGNVFAVSTFGIDDRQHHHIHQHPPGAGHIGYVIPPPDAYQTFQRHHSQRGEDLPRGLARAPDSHYFYG